MSTITITQRVITKRNQIFHYSSEFQVRVGLRSFRNTLYMVLCLLCVYGLPKRSGTIFHKNEIVTRVRSSTSAHVIQIPVRPMRRQTINRTRRANAYCVYK